MKPIRRAVRLLNWPILGLGLLGGVTGVVHAAKPEITNIRVDLPMNRVRVMTSAQLVAEVDKGGDPRSLVYLWRIEQHASGAERLEPTNRGFTSLQLWWQSAETANSLIGQTVRVSVTVSFEGATEEDESATREVELTIEGVKHPPVPAISGDGLNEPVPCGQGCRLGFDAWASTDPDNEGWSARWGIDRVSPPTVPVTKVGSEGSLFSVLVPPLITEMNIQIRLRLFSHLHEVDTTAVARLTPAGGGQSANSAPTLSAPPSVSVTQGQPLTVVANASDANGDTLAFTWMGSDTSAISPSYVDSRRTSAAGAAPSTWTSTLSYPTTGLGPGTYQFSVQAYETNTAQTLSSPRVFISVVVGGGSGGVAEPPPPANETPEPRIRYDLEGNGTFLGPHESGHTIQTDSRVIILDAGASTDDGGLENLQFRWAKGFLEPGTFQTLTGPQTTLTLPAGAQGKVTVTLTATDNEGKFASTSLAFQLLAVNEPPTARIRYAAGGSGPLTGPFAGGHVVETESRTILLDAGASTDDGGLEQLQFSWGGGGLSGAVLSGSQGIQTTVTVPSGAEGTVTVQLTVTDEGGLSASTTLAFQYSLESPVLTASIVGAPVKVQSGEEFSVEGLGSSSNGNGSLHYQWTAVCEEGRTVQVYSAGPQAKVVAPLLNGNVEEGWVTVSLVVHENGVASDPALIEIPVTRPTLHFAQAAVGGIDAATRFETAIVLVNPTQSVAEGSILFVNNFHGAGWTVLVDGAPHSEMPFELMPGEAAEFVLTGMDVEIGWLKIASNVGVVGHLFYRVVDIGSEYVLSEVPILPVVGRGFRTGLGRGSNGNVAIAMVNLGRDEVRFRVRAAESDGRAVETYDLVIGPGEHMARFLAEIMDGVHNSDTRIPADFSGGTLSIELVEGEGVFAATIMRTRDGLPLSILPVATPR